MIYCRPLTRLTSPPLSLRCDVLMKYLYRGLGMEGREKLYPMLLKWHPLVLTRAGQASVVRTISEVKRQL